MKRSHRLLTLLLVLPFLAGTNSFAGNPVADTKAADVPALSVLSPSGQTVDFYRADSGWQAVSAEQLAGLSKEVDAIPEFILDKINAITAEANAAGDPGWTCEVVKHSDGPWTWNCWRDS